MATEPVLSGDIPSGGVLEILREIEVRRITGKIRFVIGDESGEVELVAGQIAMDQDALPSGADPVEALLQARGGIFAVHAVLPPLAVSQGNDHERRGSLAVHVPADLMSYCEQAGLTGVLDMRNEGRVVEVLYEAGEMLGIRLDGREEADLDQVFAWDQGSFRIAARTEEDVRSRLPPPMSALPEPPDDPSEREPTIRYARPTPQATPIVGDGGATSRFAKVDASGREDTGRNFLRVIEMALTEVVSVREKARASVRSAPPPPKARPSVRPMARPARQKDTTVRIVWIGGEPSVEHEVPAAARAPSSKPQRPAEPSRPIKPPAAPAKLAPEPAPKRTEPIAKGPEPVAKASEPVAKVSEPIAKASEPIVKPAARAPDPEPRVRPDAPVVTRAEGPREQTPALAPAGHARSEAPSESAATIALLVAFLVGVGLLAWFIARG